MTKEEFLESREDYIGLLMQGQSNRLNVYIEGKDDYNFYYSHLRSFKPNMIKCFYKKNVLKVANIHNKIGSSKSIFFIDRDFDENEDIKNVFVTDFYNFESHIFSRKNISDYLENKHAIPKKDIDKLCTFLNSDFLLKIFHTEYERIKNNDGNAENKLLDGKLSIIDIDENYNFEPEKLFSKQALPNFSETKFEFIEMYNGKYIGNLLFGIFKSTWFSEKFKSDSIIKEKKQFTSDMIMHAEIPKYLEKAISLI
ncbi:hypothetical protein [Aliarcobacter butzleri]|uniref:hypothetical protein n=1 Tax=Aliarcobacter butzleri TaxID=28197 RepID=UPI00125F917F|nr:hypothetical protein [Aliarcobacter butzleri]